MNTVNYSSFRQSKGANLGLKCTNICLAVGFRLDPLGELMRSPRPFSRNDGPTSKAGRRGERRRGEQIREKGRGNGGEGNGGETWTPVTKTQLRPCLHAILWFSKLALHYTLALYVKLYDRLLIISYSFIISPAVCPQGKLPVRH